MQRPEDNGRILLYQFLPYPLRPDLLLNLGLGVFFFSCPDWPENLRESSVSGSQHWGYSCSQFFVHRC